MKSITFDKFDIGLDLRKGASVSDASRMRVLQNAYVTIGKVLRKRPGISLVETFTGGEAGTKGLVSGNGKLNTFVEGPPAGHANALFKMNRLAHPTLSQDINDIDLGDIFGGYLYVSALYDDSSRYHHYLDTEGDPPYESKAYIAGEYVSGVANNTFGLRWKCTTGTPTVSVTACTTVANTVVTTGAAHGLVAGDIAKIGNITSGTFTEIAISEISVGTNAKVKITGHPYAVGQTIHIHGVTDGVFSEDINGDHIVVAAGLNNVDIAVACYEKATTGYVGSTDLSGDWYVLATPAPTPTTFAVACACTVAISGAGTLSKKATTEPVWTNAVGDTVTDGAGTTVFTAESTYIEDPDCPHTNSFTTAASKVWAIDGSVVRACAVSRPRVWDATLQYLPGVILPVSSHARGSSETTAVAQYDGRLSVFFSDSVQFWNVDPDPAQDAYFKSVEGVGTIFPATPKEFAGDVIFLAASGIRSVTTLQYGNENLAENDVGSAIDALVKPQTSSLINPFTEFYTRTGQYWCVMKEVTDQPVWAFTFSRTQKISAWAEYKFLRPDGAGGTTQLGIDAMAVVGSELYLRSGEEVYKVDSDDTVFDDNGVDYEMRIEFPYLDFKAPADLKYIASMDVVLQGSCDVQFRFDPNNPAFITDKIRITGDTRQKASIPLEITAASIAPVFTDTSGNDVQIEAITFHFENLGPISG